MVLPKRDQVWRRQDVRSQTPGTTFRYDILRTFNRFCGQMNPPCRRRSAPLGPALALLAAISAAPLPAQSGGSRGLSPAEQENFLLTAKVIESHTLAEGVTGSIRATLSDGKLTHDAHIQHVDESEPSFELAAGYELNFRDSYKFNIAAYQLDRMLGLGMIPAAVERKIDGKPAALSWWIDDVMMTEKTRYASKLEPPDSDVWNQQIYRVRVFDQLIYNVDRNLGNIVITNDWKVWMIDHTRAFRLHKKLNKPQHLMKCDRHFLQALRNLDREECRRKFRGVLKRSEISALLARRNLIVSYFEREAAEQGEGAVLFDYSGP